MYRLPRTADRARPTSAETGSRRCESVGAVGGGGEWCRGVPRGTPLLLVLTEARALHGTLQRPRYGAAQHFASLPREDALDQRGELHRRKRPGGPGDGGNG